MPNDLWQALREAAPELAESLSAAAGVERFRYQDTPGFREFLITEFALNTPARVLRDKLDSIIEQQQADGVPTWPHMGKRQLETARRDLQDEWLPVRARIVEAIEHVGVIDKQQRLLAYQTLIEVLQDKMWDERNEKTGQLYLQQDYLKALRAVAEEMGDLGKPVNEGSEGLVEIAKELIELVKVQGSGLQDTGKTESEYDYQLD